MNINFISLKKSLLASLIFLIGFLLISFVLVLTFNFAAFSGDDTIPPVISGPFPTGLVASAAPAVGALVTDDAYVSAETSGLSIDGALLSTGLTYDSGSRELSAPVGALPDGQHSVSLVAADQAGNNSSLNWTFTIDTTPPAITGGAPAELSVQTVASNTLPSYYIYVKDVNKIQSAKLFINNLPVSRPNLMNWGSGQMVYTARQTLKDGTYPVRLELRDFAGNLTVRNWTIEVQGIPSIVPESPLGTVTTGSPVIKARITDYSGVDPNSVILSIDGGPSISGTAYFNKAPYYNYLYYQTTAPLTAGKHTATVKAKCLNGHEAVKTWEFSYDLTPPQLIGVSLINYPEYSANQGPYTVLEDAYLEKGRDLAFSLTVSEYPQLVTVKIDGGQVFYKLYTLPYNTNLQKVQTIGIPKQTLSDGPHTMDILIGDFSGNRAASTLHFKVAEAPSISNEAPPNVAKLPAPVNSSGLIVDRRWEAVLDNPRPTISAKISDGNNPLTAENIVFKLDGQVQPFGFDAGTGILTYTPASDLHNESVHSISITATDPTGNSKSEEWRFYLNTYPLMPWTTDKTCVSCHPDNRAIHLPRTAEEEARYGTTCKKCHGGYDSPTLKTLEQRCIACHKNQWHVAAEPQGPYHEIAFTDQTGLPAVTLDTVHKAPSESCTGCHARSINREHQRPGRTDSGGNSLTCDTCHASSEPAVVEAIKNKQTDCQACHKLGGDGHESVHVSNLDTNCTKVCHQASLTQEHLNNSITQTKELTCDTCHNSQEAVPAAAITAGQIECTNCHQQAHQLTLLPPVPTDIPLLADLQWTTPIKAKVFTGEIPADFADGSVVISSSSADLAGAEVLAGYKAQLTAKQWVQNSPDPANTNDFQVTFQKDSRQVMVRFDPVAGKTGQLYRITIAYK